MVVKEIFDGFDSVGDRFGGWNRQMDDNLSET